MSLSDKIEIEGQGTWGYKEGFLGVEDVMEAVKELKESFCVKGKNKVANYNKGIHLIIDKIFGDKLI